MATSTAQSHPNIAFIKYWGNRDNALRIPSNGSISMNLDGLFTRTTVSFQPSLPFDELIINRHEVTGAGLDRVSYILDIIRGMANIRDRAEMMTENNFPSGAGIASCASAFAALALDRRPRPERRTEVHRAGRLGLPGLRQAPVPRPDHPRLGRRHQSGRGPADAGRDGRRRRAGRARGHRHPLVLRPGPRSRRRTAVPRQPPLDEQREVIYRHFRLASEAYDPRRGLKMLRHFSLQYAKMHPRRTDLRNALVPVRTEAEWRAVIDAFYGA